MLSTRCTAAPCPDVQTPPLLGDPLCPPQPPTAPVGASAVPLLTPPQRRPAVPSLRPRGFLIQEAGEHRLEGVRRRHRVRFHSCPSQQGRPSPCLGTAWKAPGPRRGDAWGLCRFCLKETRRRPRPRRPPCPHARGGVCTVCCRGLLSTLTPAGSCARLFAQAAAREGPAESCWPLGPACGVGGSSGTFHAAVLGPPERRPDLVPSFCRSWGGPFPPSCINPLVSGAVLGASCPLCEDGRGQGA